MQALIAPLEILDRAGLYELPFMSKTATSKEQRKTEFLGVVCGEERPFQKD
jgi:hypothetical protein